MRAYHFSIHIDRSPAAVWEFITDLSQAPKWRTMVTSMDVVGGGPVRAGSEIRIKMASFGKMTERTVSTVAFDPPRRWVTVSGSGGLTGEFEYALSADRDGTNLTTSLNLRAHRFLTWIFLPIVARQERRFRATQLETLKKVCEAATLAR